MVQSPGDAHTTRKLIIHADDLGISERVNAGIERAHRDGILTSTSIMAVGGAFDHAVELCQANPGLDIGVHLTLVEERPLTPVAQIPSLVDPSGRFHRTAFGFTGRYFSGRIKIDEVYRELDAQLRRVRDSGIAISHLDSHQHVHMLPGLFDVTTRLARENGIPAIRIPRERLHPSLMRHAPSAARVLQQLVLNGFCRVARSKLTGLYHTDHFAGFLFGGRLDRAHLDAVLDSLPDTGLAELMCHPGEADPSDCYAHWGYSGPAELEALVDPELPARLQQLGIVSASYRELTGHLERGGLGFLDRSISDGAVGIVGAEALGEDHETTPS
jgi:chitin disaccharide deacetylase